MKELTEDFCGKMEKVNAYVYDTMYHKVDVSIGDNLYRSLYGEMDRVAWFTVRQIIRDMELLL